MTLSTDQKKMLALATVDWSPQPEKPRWAGGVIADLRRLGLVQTRFATSAPDRLATAEWRRTAKEGA